ncbi:hypothetical protein QBC35DRAFT_502443 [Podospora australis]|uniref:Uncharacterized protein n=1 Tax=Podospora australis TaxID=1536484 RepID=A0AAN6WQ19_9PEZI|nr:hypothetical protein QBC35DRAFT_502443 [Podospora australis]
MDRSSRPRIREGTQDDAVAQLAFDDLNERAGRILALLSKLEQAASAITSLAWEREWERNDLLEDVQSLRQIIRETVARSSHNALPSGAKGVIEAGIQEKMQDLETALKMEKSKSWELEEQCKDMGEDIGMLERQLRNSIAVGDVKSPPVLPRTALEKALQDRILELEDRMRNPMSRGRSRSI